MEPRPDYVEVKYISKPYPEYIVVWLIDRCPVHYKGFDSFEEAVSYKESKTYLVHIYHYCDHPTLPYYSRAER